MAKESTRSRLTGEEVLALLDEEEEDGMEDTFFPGSDNDFGLSSDDEGTVAGEDRWEYWVLKPVQLWTTTVIQNYLPSCSAGSSDNESDSEEASVPSAMCAGITADLK